MCTKGSTHDVGVDAPGVGSISICHVVSVDQLVVACTKLFF